MAINKDVAVNELREACIESTATIGFLMESNVTDNHTAEQYTVTNTLSATTLPENSLAANLPWSVGLRVEARDFTANWYSAKVIQVDWSGHRVLIHFDGWNQRYDEWISMNSDRLRQVSRHSSRRDLPRAIQKEEYDVGEYVFARWSDCRMYPAVIRAVNHDGSLEVMFFDGVKKIVLPMNVKGMTPETQQEYVAAGLLPSYATRQKAGENTTRNALHDKKASRRCSTEPSVAPTSAVKRQRTISGCESSSVVKCLVASCGKSFRTQRLLDYHVKHYHNQLLAGTEDSGTSHRCKTLSISSVGSSDSEISIGSPQIILPTRRQSRFLSSISSIHTDDTVENDDKDELEEVDEVVNCSCQEHEEDGFMIQCESCLLWQHGSCVNIDKHSLPDKYICIFCSNPRGLRESAKYSLDEDWLQKGWLTRFSFLPDDLLAKRKAQIVKATHSLVGDILNIQKVLAGIRICINALKEKKVPDLAMRSNVASEVQSNPVQCKDISVVSERANSTAVEYEDYMMLIEVDNEEQGGKEDVQLLRDDIDLRKRSLSGNINIQIVDNNEISPAKAEPSDVDTARADSKDGDKLFDVLLVDSCSATKLASNDEQLQAHENRQDSLENAKIDSSIDGRRTACAGNSDNECTLLQYITNLQTIAENQLNIIQQQLSVIESAENEDVKADDILKDVPRIKKSLTQLIKDLKKVQKMIFYKDTV